MNVNNSTAPFVSITWHQKESWGCVAYSHCPTNNSCNKCILCCSCLLCNYATKPFGILQRVSKRQKVCISFGHRKSRYLFSQKRLSIWGNVLMLQNAHGNFLILCQMVLLPNINFLISKQNKTPKIDPKMLEK